MTPFSGFSRLAMRSPSPETAMKFIRNKPPRAHCVPRSWAPALAALLAAFSLPAAAAMFNVTTGTDGSQQVGNTTTCVEVDNTNMPTNNGCSLRAAIMLGNNITGPHTITFAPSVVKVTVVNGGMAQLRAQYTVIGALPIRTAIDGNGHGCIDLEDAGTEQLSPPIHNGNGATGSTVSNLAIGNCSGAGISANGHGYTFNNNYIGVDPTGLIAWPNSGNGIWLSASINYQDQFVDTNALNALNSALPVQPVSAADISNFSSNLASVLQNLQPNTIKDNVISSNALNGIELFSKSLAATLISNNMIGTDPTGATAKGNGNNGVHLTGSTFGNLIGPNNVIAGNAQNGILAEAGAVFLPNFIMGNRIGLSNINGSHVGNGLSGISVDTKPSTDPAYFNPSLTGLVIGPLNLIADNQGANNNNFPDVLGSDNAGIIITGASTGIKVLGNTIGIAEFPTGTPLASKTYGNLGDGIIITTSGNQIGGSGASDGNIIAANARHGIVVSGSSTTGNSFVGNSVGVHPSLGGNLALGNGVDGFHIDNASSTTIGGSGSTDFNTIAANGRNGVKIVNGGTGNGWGNLLQRNRIYHNAVNAATPGVGIDLDRVQNASNPLITAPSEIPANYTNLDQAQPVICAGPADPGACAGSTAPASVGNNTTLQWTISTHGPAKLRVEFFGLDNANANAALQFGWAGEQAVDTDASGLPTGAGCSGGRCTVTVSGSLTGAWVAATATDVTLLTDQPGAPGDWKAGLKCFIGNFGNPTLIISSCPANNTSEFSAVVKVPAIAPTATTLAASGITATAATFNGIVNDNGADTTVSFEYGTDTTYGSSIAATPATVSAGFGNTMVAATPASLTCGTTYHFRVNANNGIGGTVHGNDMSFMTSACPAGAPTAVTTAATAITVSAAQLNGTVNDHGATTAISFEYGPDTNYGTSATAVPASLPAGSGNTVVTGALSVLTCNSTYHFRIKANNGIGGTINGNDMSFTTSACPAAAPTAVTTAATAITASAAQLNGTVNDNGATTAISFEYGPDTNYGTSATAVPASLPGGSGSTAITGALSGLTCNSTYHFRIKANNGIGGTINGNDMSFMTSACAAQAPTVATLAASNITATSATINGTVSANGAQTSVSFEYGLTAPAYGLSVNANAPNPLPANASNTAVTATVSNLACATLYHFRAEALNGVGGTQLGNDLTFTTAACPAPGATTLAATNVTTSSITFNGSVNPNGSLTNVYFDYGPSAGNYNNLAGGTPGTVAANSGATAVSATVAAACGTTVHFRVRASNSGGSTNGGDLSAVTGACGATPPTVSTSAATGVTASAATLNGSGNANGYATTVTYEYGTTASYGQTAPGIPNLLSGSSNTAVTANLSGLTCGTTYHFRLDANNAGGTVNTADSTFTTAACPGQPPTAATNAATAVTATSAMLNATISANGAATTVSFDYGLTASYGSNVAAAQSPLAANASNALVSIIVNSLGCGQTYHFRVKADNGNGGPVYGVDQTFTTSACAAQAPTATSLAATAIGPTSATINATVNANGAAATVGFSWGASAAYGSTVAATPASLPANAVGTAVSATLGGLTCATTYHFRVDATNVNGSGHGGDLTFTTAACPVTTFTGPTATGTGNATAVLSGGGPGCTLVNPAFVAAPASPPPGVSFPDGLFQFQASGCTGSITLTVTFPSPFMASVQYWKYGPTPSQASNHWYTLGAANNLSLLANVATFTIADGGLGDDDLTVNGTIIDAGGPSVGAAVTPQTMVPAPALDPRSLAALVALLAAFGAAGVRMQRKASRR
jgi:hypothetical protein